MIKDDAQIEADMQKYINSNYPPSMREKAIRLGGALLDDLNAFFDTIAALKAETIAARDFEQAVSDYSDAINQLPNEPATIVITNDTGGSVEVVNQRIAELQAIIDGASAEVLAFVAAEAVV